MKPTILNRGLFILGYSMAVMLLAVDVRSAAQAPSWFNVRDYGAAGDGVAKDTAAIQKAIDACAEAGGGTVCFPTGHFLSGSLHLKSHVALYLDMGAELLASPDQEDFDPYETLSFKNDSDHETSYFHYSLIWGEDIEHVAITGQGIINGNRPKRGGPKPIALKRCRFITIRDVTILNAPNYCISMLGCDYANIDGVTIRDAHCDGIDPDCCRHVRISNCHIESWDDAIVLKSSFSLGEKRSTEYITITNCILSTSCNAFKMGTESGGGFKYVTVDNLVMFDPPNQRPIIAGIALESVDGAEVEGITVSNVSMKNVRAPVFVRLGNRGRDMDTPVPGYVRNILIKQITAVGASIPCAIAGLPGYPVENVVLDGIQVEYLGGGSAELAEREVPEEPAKYPDANMFGDLPAYGLYCRHVKGLSLNNLRMTVKNPDERPFFIGEDVEDLEVSRLGGQSVGKTPFLVLQDVRRALLGPLAAPSGTGIFLKLGGGDTKNVRIMGCNLNNAKQAFAAGPEVPPDAWFESGNFLPGQ